MVSKTTTTNQLDFILEDCEDNEGEGIEEGIGVSWVSECRWLRLEEPFRFFDGSAIRRDYLKFQSVQMKENAKRWSLGFVFGQEMSEIWQNEDLGTSVFEKMRSCSFQNLKFEYIGVGAHCNWLHKYGNWLPEGNIAKNNCL